MYICVILSPLPLFGESGGNYFLRGCQPRCNLLMVQVCGYLTHVVFDVDNEVRIEPSLPILIIYRYQILLLESFGREHIL